MRASSKSGCLGIGGIAHCHQGTDHLKKYRKDPLTGRVKVTCSERTDKKLSVKGRVYAMDVYSFDYLVPSDSNEDSDDGKEGNVVNRSIGTVLRR